MLKNRNVLVVGGEKGIGKAIVLKLAENGANVWFTYSTAIAYAEQTKKDAMEFGTVIDFFPLDLKDNASIAKLIESINEKNLIFNVLVNNAGYTDDNLFMRSELDKWWGVFQVIFDGAVKITHALLPNMITQDNARIINISSIAGLTAISGQTNYCSAKSALIMFTKTLGKEVARLGVTVNAIAPGYVDTDMTKGYDKETKKAFKKLVPMNRFGKPEEIAEVALFLASNMSSYITSQVIVVDGGML
ncbi:MAG: 3-oxoacyl-ACP reductase FabG [Bacteroidales bacterium]|nr:3-oxoacyl-ACP reductase FabG [Bacteroidales bacterium]